MIRKIAIAIVALVVGLLAYAATRPDTFHIERSTEIRAPAEKIFPLVSDLHRWREWSPWEDIDPEMQRTYSGAESGAGAVYAWDGNSEVGSGRMEIVAVAPPREVEIRLDFITPFEAHNTARFTLLPDASATRVTWAMSGPNAFLGKLIGVFMDMDAMIGDSFETGLANLKRIAES